MKENEKRQTLLVYHDLIASIVAALEAKDQYSANHSIRVGDMTEELCLSLGFTRKRTEEIHMAAHVHDIGKIGVPDSILTKVDKLSEEEWISMKKHPLTGFNILSKSKGLSGIAEIVMHHHERWDGNGYPQGLSGKNIPLGSRVIAVCDSIDAMLSKRPYRGTMSEEACKFEIMKNSGIMYDPDIVETVLINWGRVVSNNCFQEIKAS